MNIVLLNKVLFNNAVCKSNKRCKQMNRELKANLPKSYLSEEEIQEILILDGEECLYLEQSRRADECGDNEAGWQWLALTELPTHSLACLKEVKGAEFIKKYNFNTTEADKKYGKGWLDQ